MYAITLKERLQQYAKIKFGSYKAMEVHCGLVNGQIGNNQGLNVTSVQKVLEKCPNLSPDWLILGMGTMERSPDNLESISLENIKKIKAQQEAISQEQKQDQVAEPTNIYHLNLPSQGEEPLVTIPSSLLKTIQSQLEQKDNQIAKLLALMTSK